MIRTRPTTLRFVLTTLLLSALLMGQWVGLRHGIEHAGWQQTQSLAALDSAPAGQDGGQRHAKRSCLLFDAASAADAIHATSLLVLIPTAAYLALAWTSCRSWDALFTLHFSSRAPPLA